MKKLNFEKGTKGERFMCSRNELMMIIQKGVRKYEVIGVTPKGVIVEFLT